MTINHFCYTFLIITAIGSIFSPHPFVIWMMSLNILPMVIYGVDKIAARKTWRRIPEFTLLVFGALGGWLGAMAGQQLFRHKTRKQPFRTYFILSVIVSVSIMIGGYLFHPFSFY